MDNPIIENHKDYPDRSLFIWPNSGYWLIADKDFWRDFLSTINSGLRIPKEYKTVLKELGLRGIDIDQNLPVIRPKSIPLNFKPTKLVISLTDNCNLRCPYCYASSTPERNCFIDKKSIIDALSFIAKLNNNKKHPYTSKVSIVGGEPFLHADLIDILNFTFKNGFIVSITTNGTINIPASVLTILKDTRAEINLSIDGHTPQIHNLTRTSSFDRVLSLSNTLIKKGIPVSVTTVLHEGNLPFIEEHIQFFYEKGFQGISLNTINHMGRGQEVNNRILKSKLYPILFNLCLSKPHLKDFLRSTSFYLFIYKLSKGLTQKDCGLSNKSFFLNYDGKLYVCGALKEDEFIIPITGESDFFNNVDTVCEKVVEKYNVEKIEKCTECFYKYFCAGDCRGEANEVFNNKLEIHPDCKDYKILYKEMMFKLSEFPDFIS